MLLRIDNKGNYRYQFESEDDLIIAKLLVAGQ
jgi:hypothetical protein